MIDTTSDEQAILDRERAALDQWAQGRAARYYDDWADDVTYFDDIGAHRRIDGIGAMRAYGASLDGKVPPHRYELLDPKVQVIGDVAIVTRSVRARWKAAAAMEGDARVPAEER